MGSLPTPFVFSDLCRQRSLLQRPIEEWEAYGGFRVVDLVTSEGERGLKFPYPSEVSKSTAVFGTAASAGVEVGWEGGLDWVLT